MAINGIVQYTCWFPDILLFTQAPILVWFDGTITIVHWYYPLNYVLQCLLFSFELPFSLMFSSDTRKERETQLAEHVSHRRPLRLFYRVSARLSLFPKTSNRGFSFHRCGELFLLYVTSQTTKSQNGTLPFTLPLCIPSFPSPSKEKGWVSGKERNLLASESDQLFVSLSLCSPTA